MENMTKLKEELYAELNFYKRRKAEICGEIRSLQGKQEVLGDMIVTIEKFIELASFEDEEKTGTGSE